MNGLLTFVHSLGFFVFVLARQTYLDVERNGLAGEGFNEDLHGCYCVGGWGECEDVLVKGRILL